jgi:hypothetical protein
MKKPPLFFPNSFFLLLGLQVLLILSMRLFDVTESLDVKMYYTGDQARAFLQNMNAENRNAYFVNELIDLLFICAYTASLWIGLRWVYPKDKIMWPLAFAPAAFDLLETLHIIYALKIEGPHLFFDWLGVVTFLKWLLAFGACVALVRGLLRNRKRALSHPSLN